MERYEDCERCLERFVGEEAIAQYLRSKEVPPGGMEMRICVGCLALEDAHHEFDMEAARELDRAIMEDAMEKSRKMADNKDPGVPDVIAKMEQAFAIEWEEKDHEVAGGVSITMHHATFETDLASYAAAVQPAPGAAGFIAVINWTMRTWNAGAVEEPAAKKTPQRSLVSERRTTIDQAKMWAEDQMVADRCACCGAVKGEGLTTRP